ncbi:MAG: iron-sulfur cluster carrier protein [Planctomycetota bacterium]
MLTTESLLAVLDEVQDPDLGQSIVKMGMIQHIRIEDSGTKLAFTCELTTPACPLKEKIEADIRAAVAQAFPGVQKLELTLTGKVKAGAMAAPGGENLVPQIKNVILVDGGKGGVGKSTLAVNLAYALQALGARTALLDLDVFAPALPSLLGRQERPKLQGQEKIQPLVHNGLETMSMGYLVDPRQAMIWRGPILGGIVSQFLRDVVWSEADYLVVDLPPGNTDIPLALAQHCAAAGVVLVTTPQRLSLDETRRRKPFYDQMRVPLLGLIENRIDLRTPHSGLGAGALAEEWGVPFLAELPFAPELAVCADRGAPCVEAMPDHPIARILRTTAERMAAQISIQQQAAAPAT